MTPLATLLYADVVLHVTTSLTLALSHDLYELAAREMQHARRLVTVAEYVETLEARLSRLEKRVDAGSGGTPVFR